MNEHKRVSARAMLPILASKESTHSDNSDENRLVQTRANDENTERSDEEGESGTT